VPETLHTDQQHRGMLQNIAQRAMLERGLRPTFSATASAEVQSMQAQEPPTMRQAQRQRFVI
jgi:hypothetical protein